MSYAQVLGAVEQALASAGLDRVKGKVLFVDSTNAKAVNSTQAGKSARFPLATIDYAIGRCTANAGDTIVVLPGHTETITAAGGITLDVAGVSIVGVGNQRNRPTINYTTSTAGTFLVTAANCAVHNVVFNMTGIDAVASGIAVQAAGFSLLGCEVIHATASGQATVGLLTTAGADRLRIDGCRFVGTSDAGTATAIRIVGGDGITISNNFIFGAYTDTLGGIENNTTAATRLLIENNTIVNLTGTSTKAIVVDANTTGVVRNNSLGIRSGTAPITGNGLNFVGGNYYKAALGVGAGTLL
jgi:hypothetical protein